MDKNKLADAKKHFNELLEVLFKPRDQARAKNIIRELEEKLPSRRIKLTNQIFSLITPGITEDEWIKLKGELKDNCGDPSWVLWMLGETRLQAMKESGSTEQ
jgi:hypothetical protein